MEEEMIRKGWNDERQNGMINGKVEQCAEGCNERDGMVKGAMD